MRRKAKDEKTRRSPAPLSEKALSMYRGIIKGKRNRMGGGTKGGWGAYYGEYTKTKTGSAQQRGTLRGLRRQSWDLTRQRSL